jgi:hypothetical protein
MRRQLGLGLASVVAALVLLLVAMWALSPDVKEHARPPKKAAMIAPPAEPAAAPAPTPKDVHTGRENKPVTKPGEHADKPNVPPPPYMAPILDDLTPGGPPTSPEAMKTPEGRAAAGLQMAWGGIAQGMSDKANYVPEATQLEADAFAIADEYRNLRRGETADWDDLQRRQQALLDKMDNVDGLSQDNPAYADGRRKLSEKLAAYQQDKRKSGK